MSLILAAVLGTGVLLVASPWLWPARRRPSASAPRRGPGPVARMLAEAGFPAAPAAAVPAVSAGGAAAAAAAMWLIVGVPAVSVLAGVAASAAPALWLRSRALRRRKARRGMWPDVCDLLIGAIRSGLPVPEAVAQIAESVPPELRPAFRSYAADLSASGQFDSSATRLKTMLADPTADRILETLRMARQVGGGHLVPVLRALSAAVRSDTAMRAEVEARQSWTRGAAVLGVVAPWVILLLLSLRPEGAAAYSSTGGVLLICAGTVVSVLAYRLMLQVGRLPEPGRWLG